MSVVWSSPPFPEGLRSEAVYTCLCEVSACLVTKSMITYQRRREKDNKRR